MFRHEASAGGPDTAPAIAFTEAGTQTAERFERPGTGGRYAGQAQPVSGQPRQKPAEEQLQVSHSSEEPSGEHSHSNGGGAVSSAVARLSDDQAWQQPASSEPDPEPASAVDTYALDLIPDSACLDADLGGDSAAAVLAGDMYAASAGPAVAKGHPEDQHATIVAIAEATSAEVVRQRVSSKTTDAANRAPEVLLKNAVSGGPELRVFIGEGNRENLTRKGDGNDAAEEELANNEVG